MRVVFYDFVRMGCVKNVGWAAMVLTQNALAAWVGSAGVRDAVQVVEAVKTAMCSGDTDLRLPNIAWDTVEAAWGTTWEKDWEDVVDTPQRQCVMGSRWKFISIGWLHPRWLMMR
jgi:hypothetical protein